MARSEITLVDIKEVKLSMTNLIKIKRLKAKYPNACTQPDTFKLNEKKCQIKMC